MAPVLWTGAISVGAHRIGGELTLPVLPHHPAYGSAHGGSSLALKTPMLLRGAHESHVVEDSAGYGLMHVRETCIPPRSKIVEGRRRCLHRLNPVTESN